MKLKCPFCGRTEEGELHYVGCTCQGGRRKPVAMVPVNPCTCGHEALGAHYEVYDFCMACLDDGGYCDGYEECEPD